MRKRLDRIDDGFLLKISLLGYLAFKAFTFNLWFSFYRDFPLVAPVDFLNFQNSVWIDGISILSSLLIIILIFRLKKTILILFLILEVFVVSIDMMRWQPAVFQALLTILAFTFYKKQFKFMLLLILSATYIFSGLNKLNLRFINVVWCYSILVDFLGVAKDIAFLKVIKGIGFMIPVAEIVAGILILTKWRKIGFYTIILTHLFILAYVGPLGINYNSAVWPWNVLMIVYALAFMNIKFKGKLKINFSLGIWVIVLFVLPVLNFKNLYYPYFSFDLYSGSKSLVYILYEETDEKGLSNYSRHNDSKNCFEIDVNAWSFKNLTVPTTHSEFLFRRIAESFENQYQVDSLSFEVSKYPYKVRETLNLNP